MSGNRTQEIMLRKGLVRLLVSCSVTELQEAFKKCGFAGIVMLRVNLSLLRSYLRNEYQFEDLVQEFPAFADFWNQITQPDVQDALISVLAGKPMQNLNKAHFTDPFIENLLEKEQSHFQTCISNSKKKSWSPDLNSFIGKNILDYGSLELVLQDLTGTSRKANEKSVDRCRQVAETGQTRFQSHIALLKSHFYVLNNPAELKTMFQDEEFATNLLVHKLPERVAAIAAKSAEFASSSSSSSSSSHFSAEQVALQEMLDNGDYICTAIACFYINLRRLASNLAVIAGVPQEWFRSHVYSPLWDMLGDFGSIRCDREVDCVPRKERRHFQSPEAHGNEGAHKTDAVWFYQQMQRQQQQQQQQHHHDQHQNSSQSHDREQDPEQEENQKEKEEHEEQEEQTYGDEEPTVLSLMNPLALLLVEENGTNNESSNELDKLKTAIDAFDYMSEHEAEFRRFVVKGRGALNEDFKIFCCVTEGTKIDLFALVPIFKEFKLRYHLKSYDLLVDHSSQVVSVERIHYDFLYELPFAILALRFMAHQMVIEQFDYVENNKLPIPLEPLSLSQRESHPELSKLAPRTPSKPASNKPAKGDQNASIATDACCFLNQLEWPIDENFRIPKEDDLTPTSTFLATRKHDGLRVMGKISACQEAYWRELSGLILLNSTPAVPFVAQLVAASPCPQGLVIATPFYPGSLEYSASSSSTPERSLEEIRKLFQQLMTALLGMHKRGVVHLDIKPKNLRCDSRGDLVVIDFDTCRFLFDISASGSVKQYNVFQLSGQDLVLPYLGGTRGWRAVELERSTCSSVLLGPGVDVYAAGLVLLSWVYDHLERSSFSKAEGWMGVKEVFQPTLGLVKPNLQSKLELSLVSLQEGIQSFLQGNQQQHQQVQSPDLYAEARVLCSVVNLLCLILKVDLKERSGIEEILKHSFLCEEGAELTQEAISSSGLIRPDPKRFPDLVVRPNEPFQPIQVPRSLANRPRKKEARLVLRDRTPNISI